MIDVTDLRHTIVPKSDQLNADQLIGGPMTITVTRVSASSGDQPVTVHYEGDKGRPFKPCLTMRKVLVLAWGHDGTQWPGKSMRVYNDPDVRFQMLWSDPSEADHVPDDLQQSTARFPFGRKQFHSFMQRLGLTTMVRGHERVVQGFKVVYDDPEARLLSLFSAGGATNADLPEKSNYREVTPMALTIKWRDGRADVTPFPIAYERYNDPRYNRFFAEQIAAG